MVGARPDIEIGIMRSTFEYSEAHTLVEMLIKLGPHTTPSEVVHLLDQLGAKNITGEEEQQ